MTTYQLGLSFGPLVADSLTHIQVALPVFDVVGWYLMYSDYVSYLVPRTKAGARMETHSFL